MPRQQEVLEGLVCLVEEPHHATLACVRVRARLTNWFSVEPETRQGCVLSAVLFNVLMDELMTKPLEAKVGGVKFKDLS